MRIRRLLLTAGTALAIAGVGSAASASSVELPGTITTCRIDRGWMYTDGEGQVHVAEDPGTRVVYCYY